ncbi:hypothetical protein NQZ68_039340 [Dissostichus eleginoides]|nr:hypothetical protein NQZ68_039340 [Dissostichus eleginoides]
MIGIGSGAKKAIASVEALRSAQLLEDAPTTRANDPRLRTRPNDPRLRPAATTRANDPRLRPAPTTRGSDPPQRPAPTTRANDWISREASGMQRILRSNVQTERCRLQE